MAAANSMTLNVILTMMIAFAAVEIVLRLTNKKYGGGGVGGGNCAKAPPAAAAAPVRCADTRPTSMDSQSHFSVARDLLAFGQMLSRGCAWDVCSGSGSGSGSGLRAHRRWRRWHGRR